MHTNSQENPEKSSEEQLNKELLEAAIRLNTWLLAGVFACVFGLSLFGLTYLSLYRGLPDVGQYLNLLGVFLPGYEVSVSGAWIGLFWAAILGAFIAVLFYRLYARSMGAEIQRLLDPETHADPLTGSTLFIDGKSLGLALGAVVAGGLIISTNWLVIRGTADESVHAMLLVNYLPGYSISVFGSLIGAIEIFIMTYLLSVLFSWVYNRMASLRNGASK